MVNRSPVAKLQYFKDRKGKFRWRLMSHNGRHIADSGQGYATKFAAQKGWQAVAGACAGDHSAATGRHVVEDLTLKTAARKKVAKAVRETVRKPAPKKATAKKRKVKRGVVSDARPAA